VTGPDASAPDGVPAPPPTAPARIVFFGSGAFALPILERLASLDSVRLVAVVSTPDRPAGRHGDLAPTPVAVRARAAGIPLLQPASLRTDEAAAELGACRPDAAVLADYGRILPASILAVPPHGFLDLHPSLLPRHRGATPIPASIAAGDPETGVTLFRMDPGMDTGPIVAASRRTLDGTEDAPALEAALAADAADLLAASLAPWLSGDLPERPQPDAGVTVTRPFRRADGALDPAMPAAALERRVRALRPWPGTYLEMPDGRLIVRAASVASGPGPAPGAASGAALGDVVAHGAGLALVTADGLLVLDVVQTPGGRAMTGAEARRGRPTLAGARTLRPVSESVAT
jgi:methionyl-tRNA formyltransferase